MQFKSKMKESIGTIGTIALLVVSVCTVAFAEEQLFGLDGSADCKAVATYAANHVISGGRLESVTSCRFDSNKEFFQLDLKILALGREFKCKGIRVQVRGWGKEETMKLTSKGNCS